jgi:hypothetical protein
MPIPWVELGLAGLNFGSSLLNSGGDDKESSPQGVMVLPQQRALLDEMLAKYYAGQGDFGQTSAMREGRDTLYGEAASSGVPISSGNVQAGLAAKFGEAAKQSGLERMLYGLQLAQASPAFANTTSNMGYSGSTNINKPAYLSLSRYGNSQNNSRRSYGF